MIRPHTLLPFALLAAGCTEGGGGLLDVSFDRLDVQAIDFDGADADFVFRIENNTAFGLSVAEFDYALQFADVEWLSGSDPDGLTLYADDYSEVALPTSVVFGELYDMVQAARGSDSIGFGLDGNFGLALASDTITYEDGSGTDGQASSQGISQGDDGTYILDIPYNAGGDFPALRRPKFSYNKIKVADISLSGATLDLKLNVDNEHASNLWFTNFDYDLGLNGATIASGVVADLGEVAGASIDASGEASAAAASTLTLPIELDFADLGAVGVELYSALTGNGSLNLDLAAATDVDTPFGVVTLAIDESGDVSIE